MHSYIHLHKPFSYGEGFKLSSPLNTRERSYGFFLLNAKLSFPVNPSLHGEGVSFSSPLNASSYIPPHKSFLTWGRIPLNTWLSLTTWGRSQAFFLVVHPSPASPPPKKTNATLPFPTNPLPSICMEGSFPLQNAKPHKSSTVQILFYIFIFHFIFIYLHYCFEFFLFKT